MPRFLTKSAVRWLSRGAAALLLASLTGSVSAPSLAYAAASRANIAVGAIVLPRTDITSAMLPEALLVTERDVARGFVDLPRAARLTIRNTSPAGFALEVQPLSPAIAGIEVLGSGAQVIFDGAGGSIAERGLHGREIPLTLGFRLALAPQVPAGRYPWPIAFAVRPLAPGQ